MLIVAVVLGVLLILIFVWTLCRSAAIGDRHLEKFDKWKNDHDQKSTR